ncbi:MAG: lipopolysaccharide heptosyltransferase II [Sinobacteraceae bacterium]|nr:lipopolysaccharide heptosyltransferase II [Nevskiaceae bacterium]
MASRILVIGPAWVGDMVMAQSLFRRLREDDPDCIIDVVAPGWSLPVLQRMPEVRRGIELAAGHGEFGWRARHELGHRLRAGRYDRGIVLPNSWKSALVPWFAKIPRRIGYARELRYGLVNDLRKLDKTLLKTTVERFVALAEPFAPSAPPQVPWPCLRADAANGKAVCARLGLSDDAAVAFMPGAAYGPAKRWPAAHFAALARQLGHEGLHCWVLGSAGESALGEEIAAASDGAAVNLCGKTGLGDVIDLLGRVRAAVTNDSGLMHVAAAVGTPVVVLYGSSTPDFTPPLTTRKKIHYLRLDCSPCFERECPLGHLNCLRQISPEAVAASTRALVAL